MRCFSLGRGRNWTRFHTQAGLLTFQRLEAPYSGDTRNLGVIESGLALLISINDTPFLMAQLDRTFSK